MGQDSEWIFASVINFLQSPLWSTPVFNFVDQNSIFFDKEEENKFEYTSIHEVYSPLFLPLSPLHLSLPTIILSLLPFLFFIHQYNPTTWWIYQHLSIPLAFFMLMLKEITQDSLWLP
jgi:hypothetical protein